MRIKPCASSCLALVFLLSPVFAHGQAATTPAVNSQAVRGWEGTITIPTYKLGPADPNPPFPLVSREPIYPYTMLDDLTDDRVPMSYRAIYLENQYLKITILPDLGGHVYSVYGQRHQVRSGRAAGRMDFRRHRVQLSLCAYNRYGFVRQLCAAPQSRRQRHFRGRCS
jgi:hypothetical protein